MIPQFYYGHDYGNSTVAGVAFINGKRYGSVTFPSLSAPGSLRQLEDIRTSAGLPVFGKEDYLLQMDGQDIYWGKLAFESSDATAARGDVSRYWSTRSLEALLVASGSLIPVEDYELFVTTGLPVETYTKEHRKAVHDALSGPHRFYLNGRPKYVNIHVTQVIMEGAGAIIAYGDKRDDIRQGAIDIGGRTTDLFVTQGQAPRPALCKGKPLGVEKVGELLQQMVQEHLSGHTLEVEELYKVLHASVGDGGYPTLYAHGSRIPTHLLMDWVDKAREIVAKDIVSFVSATWSSGERGIVASNFGRTILVGGGAYYFSQQMQSRIPHLSIPAEPELANALGYGALAVSLGAQSAISRIA